MHIHIHASVLYYAVKHCLLTLQHAISSSAVLSYTGNMCTALAEEISGVPLLLYLPLALALHTEPTVYMHIL
jgi:hypothetical protein